MSAKATLDIIANDKASGVVNRVLGMATSIGSGLLTAAKGAGILTGAITALGGVALHEAIEAETGLLKLRSALGDTANADALMKSLQDHAAAIQQNTKYTDDFILSLYTMGAGMGVAQEELQNTVDAALALSAATGGAMSVEAAMRALTKATAEDEAMLARFVPALKNVTDEAQRTAIMNEALARGQDILTGESQSLGGQLTMLWNNLMDVAESIGMQMLPAIHAVTDYLADSVPTIAAWAGMFVEGFGWILNALAPVGSFFMTVFRMIRDTGIAVAAGIVVVWNNLGDSLTVAADTIALAFVATYEDIKHFFGTSLPAYLNYFLDNWKSIFETAWNFVSSVFTNMYANVTNFFAGVWSWLKGEGFDFTWTGLLDGFENTLAALPEIADRQLTPLEERLANRIDALGGSLADKIAAKNREFRGALGLDAAGPEGETAPALATPKVPLGSTAKDKKEKKEEAFASSIVAVDELWKRISTGAKPTEDDQKKTANNTEQVAGNTAKAVAHAEDQSKTLKDIHGTLKEMKGGVPARMT